MKEGYLLRHGKTGIEIIEEASHLVRRASVGALACYYIGTVPFVAGLLNIPSSIITILLAARFGALADKHGPRLYLTLGPALMGTGTLVFTFVDDKSEFWTAGIAGRSSWSRLTLTRPASASTARSCAGRSRYAPLCPNAEIEQ